MRSILKNGILAIQITRELLDKAIASGEIHEFKATLRERSKGGKIKIELSVI